ncbi:MAG: HDOD domain-containing protein [Deltaproteobacteria bacterium]|jgi:putative nucleotidyltransferase with HDIG domain|nr:HDOD domain-containing protein [Deltaproteobacteria bacterium]
MIATATQPTIEIEEQRDLKARIIKATRDLPPMPDVIFKIQRTLLDPNAYAQQIADLIETDQALAARVLKIANSPFYGMTGKVASVHHAAVILGFKTLGELTTIAGFSELMGNKLAGYGYRADELWRHSLAVALASKHIAQKLNPELISDALTAGLIHDLGKLILDPYVFEQREIFDEFMEATEQTFLRAEKHILGFDHAEIAYEICRHWNFPEALALSIKYHHYPSLSKDSQMAYILHLADYIAVLSDSGYDMDEILDIQEEGTQAFLEVHQEEIRSISSVIIASIANIEEELCIY